MVTLRDIAKETGFSISTVSKVLNNTAHEVGIAEETQALVLEAARRLNYRPNKEARNLRLGKRRPLILFLSLYEGRTDGEEGFFSHPFFGELMHYIQYEVSNRGFYLSYIAVNKNNLSLIMELIHDSVNGVVTWGTIPPKLLSMLRVSKIPVAAIEPYVSDAEDLHQIYVDNHAAVSKAVDCLYKCNYTQIIMADTRLAGEEQNPVFSERVEAFIACKAKYSDVRLKLETYNRARGTSDIAAGEAIGERILGKMNEPLGVVAVNDLTAFGILNVALQNGLHIPHDVGVVGIDDIEWAHSHRPPLTTIRIPKHKLAIEAVGFLANVLNGTGAKPEILRLPVELVERQTTATQKG
jgi:LacI family transcriptional regulator